MEGAVTKGPATRSSVKRKYEAEKNVKRKKREAKLFQPRKVIGPRDILVDLGKRKVKIEVNEQDVKPEVQDLDLGAGRSLRNGENAVDVSQMTDFHGNDSTGMEDNVVIVKEEVDIPMDYLASEEAQPEVPDLNESEEIYENVQALQEKTESRPISAELSTGSSVVTMEEFRLLETDNAKKAIEIWSLQKEVAEKDARIKMLEDKVKMLEERQQVQPLTNDKNVEMTPIPIASQLEFTTEDEGQPKESDPKATNNDKDQGPSQRFQCATISICCPERVRDSVAKLEKEGFNDPTVLRIDPDRYFTNHPCKSSLRTWTDIKRKESRKVITKLLVRHGKKIKVFKYFSYSLTKVRFFRDYEYWYPTLIGWLTLLPSLEELRIDTRRCSVTYNSDMSSQMIKQVFPTLPKLKHATLKIIPFPVIRSMMLANSHVTSLEVRSYPSSGLENCLELLEKPVFPNLKKLSVFFHQPEHFGFLLELRTPQLKTIKLDFPYYHEEPICPPAIFQLLKMFKENKTLKCVQLGNVHHTELDRLPEMPRIKELILQLKISYLFEPDRVRSILEMLKPMQSLEYFEMRLRYITKYSAEYEQLYDDEFVSKMWKRLPRLRKFFIICCNERVPTYSYYRPS